MTLVGFLGLSKQELPKQNGKFIFPLKILVKTVMRLANASESSGWRALFKLFELPKELVAIEVLMISLSNEL